MKLPFFKSASKSASQVHHLTEEECLKAHYSNDHKRLPPCRRCAKCGKFVRPEDAEKACNETEQHC